MKKIKGDLILGTVTLLIGLVFGLGSFTIRHISSISDGLGARFWPQLLSVIVVLSSVALIIQSLIKMRTLRVEEETSSAEDAFNFFADKQKAISVLGAVIVYAILLPFLGFPITTIIVSGALMLILGMKIGVKLVASSLIVTTVLVLVFPILLGIPLPRGVAIFETITRMMY